MIWDEFLDRANASDEERSYFIDNFITGRPRKAEKSDSAQMFFVLE